MISRQARPVQQGRFVGYFLRAIPSDKAPHCFSGGNLPDQMGIHATLMAIVLWMI
jgi:hypothetical protein